MTQMSVFNIFIQRAAKFIGYWSLIRIIPQSLLGILKSPSKLYHETPMLFPLSCEQSLRQICPTLCPMKAQSPKFYFVGMGRCCITVQYVVLKTVYMHTRKSSTNNLPKRDRRPSECYFQMCMLPYPHPRRINVLISLAILERCAITKVLSRFTDKYF